jgi:hypothetical protein
MNKYVYKSYVSKKGVAEVAKIINRKDGSNAFIQVADDVQLMLSGSPIDLGERNLLSTEKPSADQSKNILFNITAGKEKLLVGTLISIEGAKGKFTSLRFEKDIQLMVQGKNFPLDKDRKAYLNTPQAITEKLINGGFLAEEKHESARERAANIGKTVKYVVSVPKGE